MSKEALQVLAETVDGYFNGKQRPRRIGFAIFVFEFGKTEGGRVNYVSNASRDQMLVAVREWLARAEGRVIETDRKQ
jgi:hypothetical protein